MENVKDAEPEPVCIVCGVETDEDRFCGNDCEINHHNTRADDAEGVIRATLAALAQGNSNTAYVLLCDHLNRT